MSFGPASKYAIWLGVEKFHFEYVIWSGIETDHMVICRLVGRRNSNRASKYVNCVEICHLVVGRRNMSFGGASKYVIRKYGIWSGVEICHLVGQQKMSLGLASE